ncbi:MAG: glycosyltransferase family 4 protein [Methylococcaceae bacterium]|nr:glycosyltransferase family 4 protein [Methylococcaceae bacterium]
MRVLFVVQHPIEGPTSRFRVYQFLPYLQEKGVETCVLPFLSSSELPVIYENSPVLKKIAVTLRATFRRCCHLLQARNYDIVYLVREAYPFGPPIFEYLFKKCCRRMVFDFDDAIYTPSTAYNNPLDVLRDWHKTGKLIQMADHVVPGSEYLANYVVNQGYPAVKITVIPTVVDTSVNIPAPSRKPDNAKSVVIGWIGTPRGTSYLIELMPVFTRLCEKFGGIRFLFSGAEPYDNQGLPIEFKSWRLSEEINDLQRFDIGIMPLTDDEESRGKCGFKLIQYMSVGIPSVCSPVGANNAIIAEGKSGFFAANHEEWFEKLSRMIENPILRQALGQEGRRVAEQAFSLNSAAPKLYAVLNNLMKDSA